MSLLELIADLLDGWQNALGHFSQPYDSALAEKLHESLRGIQLPTLQPESEALLRLLPPLRQGGDPPEIDGSWAHWQSNPGWGPAIGLVEVDQAHPGCTTGAELVNSLKTANDEEYVGSGSIGSEENFFSWIVGLTQGPDGPHVLVLGPVSPMAYVVLASGERELHDVIRAVRAALFK